MESKSLVEINYAKMLEDDSLYNQIVNRPIAINEHDQEEGIIDILENYQN